MRLVLCAFFVHYSLRVDVARVRELDFLLVPQHERSFALFVDFANDVFFGRLLAFLVRLSNCLKGRDFFGLLRLFRLRSGRDCLLVDELHDFKIRFPMKKEPPLNEDGDSVPGRRQCQAGLDRQVPNRNPDDVPVVVMIAGQENQVQIQQPSILVPVDLRDFPNVDKRRVSHD